MQEIDVSLGWLSSHSHDGREGGMMYFTMKCTGVLLEKLCDILEQAERQKEKKILLSFGNLL